MSVDEVVWRDIGEPSRVGHGKNDCDSVCDGEHPEKNCQLPKLSTQALSLRGLLCDGPGASGARGFHQGRRQSVGFQMRHSSLFAANRAGSCSILSMHVRPSSSTRRLIMWFECISPANSAIPKTMQQIEAHQNKNALVRHPHADKWMPLEQAILQHEKLAHALQRRNKQQINAHNLRKGVSVKYDPITGGLTGLPTAWSSVLPPSCVKNLVDESNLPPELRPAPAPPGTMLNDAPIVGRPYNVRQWSPAFGVPIESCETVVANGVKIPVVLHMLKSALVEMHGLREEGIFRITPDPNTIVQVTDELNSCPSAIPSAAASNPHILASLIKLWFRGMPDKLLSAVPIQDIFACKTDSDCIRLLRKFPAGKRDLLLWVLDLMSDVTRFSAENRMTNDAIAIVLCPNLVDQSDSLDDPVRILKSSRYTANFMIRLLRAHQLERRCPDFRAY